MIGIEATAVVPAHAETVFAFLLALENHWSVAGRGIELVSLDADRRGGLVRVHGPLGLRRTVATRVQATDPPRSLRGTATLGATRAEVSWTLSARDAGATHVRLAAVVTRAGWLDRALLRLGGARWMRRLFAATLARLSAVLGAPAPPRGTSALSSVRA